MLKKRDVKPRPVESGERFIAVDVETTGLSPTRGDRIIEIGAIAFNGDMICEEFHSLICVKKQIHWAAQQVHGITHEMLAGKPKADEVMPLLMEFIKDSTLVAHNARFDMGFISHEFLQLGMGLSNPYHCTLDLSRRLYPKLRNHKLETVYRHLFGSMPADGQTHRALDDARLVARMWMEMRKR